MANNPRDIVTAGLKPRPFGIRVRHARFAERLDEPNTTSPPDRRATFQHDILIRTDVERLVWVRSYVKHEPSHSRVAADGFGSPHLLHHRGRCARPQRHFTYTVQ